MAELNHISSLGIQTLYAGVEAVFVSRSECIFHITICKKQKGRLEIMGQESELDLAATKKLLRKISCFYLVVSGKPVIYKKLSKYYENSQELTGVLLPDAKQGEFVSQCTEAGGQFYGAVIRRDVLQEFIRSLGESKLFPQTVLLGPAVMTLLPSVLNGVPTISTSVYTVSMENDTVSFSTHSAHQPQIISMGSDQIQASNIPALCACIQAQTHYPLVTVPDDVEVKKAMGEALQKRRFKKLVLTLTLVLLVVTTGNFIFNQSYAQQYNQLEEQLALNRQMLTEIEKLEKDIDEKKSLLGKRPVSNGPVISLIGDRLAATVPAKIRLLNLEIFPLEGKISREKPVGFAFNKVLVEGVSSESDVLDKWMDQCKKFDWVKDVLIVKYTFDHEKKRGWFKLELLLK